MFSGREYIVIKKKKHGQEYSLLTQTSEVIACAIYIHGSLGRIDSINEQSKRFIILCIIYIHEAGHSTLGILLSKTIPCETL